MEYQPPRRFRRLQNLPSISTMEPPPPPQRQRLDTNDSFESTGVSKSPREPKLCYTQADPLSVEIEDFQAEEFARSLQRIRVHILLT